MVSGCLFALSKIDELDNRGKLLSIILILPIFRIANLFLIIDVFWKVFILYGVLLFLISYYTIKFKIDPGYNKKGLLFLPLVVILAVLLGIVGNFYFEIEKSFWMLFLLPVICYSEEILFRGMIQKLIGENYGVFSGVLISSLLYGIFSMGLGYLAIFMFFCGLFISLIYAIFKNIYLTIVFNFVIHFFLFILG